MNKNVEYTLHSTVGNDIEHNAWGSTASSSSDRLHGPTMYNIPTFTPRESQRRAERRVDSKYFPPAKRRVAVPTACITLFPTFLVTRYYNLLQPVESCN